MDARPPALGFVLVSFALNSVLTRFAVDGHLDAAVATTVRFLAGAVVLILVALATGRSWWPDRRNLWPAFWLAAYAFLISYGFVHVTAATGTFAFYALVLLTMVAGGAAMSRSRPATRGIVGGLVALAGIAVLSYGQGSATLLGLVLMAGTGMSWGAYSLLGRSRDDATAFTTQNFVLFALVLLLLPVVWAFTGVPGRLDGPGLAAATVMGAGTTAFAYVVWYWCLRRITVATAATVQTLIPVLTAAMGVAFLGEPWGLKLLLAGSLVVAGIALASWRRPSKA